MILPALKWRDMTGMDRHSFIEAIKKHVISALNLGDMSASDIADDAEFFGDSGLGLDSVDALELVVMIESKYSVSVDNKDDVKKIFRSPAALADFVMARSK